MLGEGFCWLFGTCGIWYYLNKGRRLLSIYIVVFRYTAENCYYFNFAYGFHIFKFFLLDNHIYKVFLIYLPQHQGLQRGRFS